eukprot:364068-Chlamydomonas_euryale.AAC.4
MHTPPQQCECSSVTRRPQRGCPLPSGKPCCKPCSRRVPHQVDAGITIAIIYRLSTGITGLCVQARAAADSQPRHLPLLLLVCMSRRCEAYLPGNVAAAAYKPGKQLWFPTDVF